MAVILVVVVCVGIGEGEGRSFSYLAENANKRLWAQNWFISQELNPARRASVVFLQRRAKATDRGTYAICCS